MLPGTSRSRQGCLPNRCRVHRQSEYHPRAAISQKNPESAEDAKRASLCDDSLMREVSSDEARRDRARLRAAMPGEVVRSGATKPNLYSALSFVERFAIFRIAAARALSPPVRTSTQSR